jgi:hypothetical protein
MVRFCLYIKSDNFLDAVLPSGLFTVFHRITADDSLRPGVAVNHRLICELKAAGQAGLVTCSITTVWVLRFKDRCKLLQGHPVAGNVTGLTFKSHFINHFVAPVVSLLVIERFFSDCKRDAIN